MKNIELKQVNSGGCCETAAKINIDLEASLNKELPIAIIGAGPVGLAAAAHLANTGERFLLIESGGSVGSNILNWGHVRLFSPWQYNIDKIAKKILEDHAWKAPVLDELPLGCELVNDYLIPLANLPEIKPYLLLNTKVVSISKKGLDKMKSANREKSSFILYLEQNGVSKRIEARAVIDATGTWSHPNPINADNVWTKEEKGLKQHIYYGIPDIKGEHKDKYKGKRVAVVGGGHSAINTILELSQLNNGVEITWIMRKKSIEDAYGGEDKDALEARGELGSRIHQLVDAGQVKVYTPFFIHQLIKTNGGITITGESKGSEKTLSTVDEIIANTGSRPDFSFIREIRLSIDNATESVEALAPLIDPNLHSCGTVRPHGEEILRQPEKDFYIVGMKSYGRAPTFLMATGYEQVRSIVAHLTGNFDSAKKVELDLPETGVCSVNLVSQSSTQSCCGNGVSKC
ncbi:NAD(P)-binding domain-containing protein [Psychrobacillus psychrodurans]|uniref:NAD(P)-binding domain-containing protein n=1 Tax=Psychrobacillus psychrodurans TaxID=126157 RepID=UPI001F4E9A00|nr:NAD(P)-binding domain-containing protein [Psychrobacillus psychrodurans]MCK1997412.1 NAD(P)-binding domain-containing protein [Psychrobacillus psychrodurans]